ncbi:MAG TPA: ABC transporter permease [Vicinamibacteria bacterium]|jgi:ABC-type transport system involved in multi-copper enzyme maturation permease subunit
MRDTTHPVPTLSAARRVFDLSLEGMLWGRRAVVMTVLLGLPVVFALLYRGVLLARLPARIAGYDLYRGLMAYFYVGNVLPLAALFYATSLVADEVDGKTLTYLTSRPITRPAIFGGKFAAFVVAAACICLPSAVVTFLLLATARGVTGTALAVPHLFRDLGVMVLTLLAYGGVFALMGVLMRRPLIPGLLFLYVWESLANLPGYLPRFTLTAWLRSLLGHAPAMRGAAAVGEKLPPEWCVAVLVGVAAAGLALSFAVFSRREYVLEQ